ncbi:hypothetical protein F5Y16DRAFT_397065 [Xylariaceae sp. FL0255]|nr:hypothetical protein F5Y16DRAFT_397065 [Xylariaceae sp. FL0255]
MSNFRSWFSPGWFRSKESRSRDAPSNREQDRVLHGRVTKHTTKSTAQHTRAAQHAGLDVERSEIDEDSDAGDLGSAPLSTGDTTEEEDREEMQDSSPPEMETLRATTEEDDQEQFQYNSEDEEDEQLVADAQSTEQDDEKWRTDEDEDNDDASDNESDEELSTVINNLSASGHEVTSASPDNLLGESSDQDKDQELDSEREWRREQIYLNTILNARNQFTLMPSTWRMRLRGIPLPDSLFYEKTKLKSIRPRIYSRSDNYEYRGVTVLRSLIDVHARIQDHRGEQADVRRDTSLSPIKRKQLTRSISSDIVNKLKRALKTALDWANEDAGNAKYGDRLLRNVKIIEMRDKFSADEPDSEEKVQTEMSELADRWRDAVAEHDGGQSQHPLPVIFGFVILRHIILIVTLDAADPEAIIHIPCQLNMAERNQHQWNALAILVTICWARDVLLNYIESVPEILPDSLSESSDPDI